MPNRHAAPRRFAAIAVLMVLLVALAPAAWAQAGATGGSSGAPGPATQSSGPTLPDPTGSGGSGENDPHARGGSGAETPGGAAKVPGIDQPRSSSGTTRGTTGGNSDCKTGAPNAADCGGPAPQR